MQHQVVVLGVLRLHRHYVQIGGHNLFHLREDSRPGKRLAREQVVQKLRLIGDFPVGRLIQDRARLRLFQLKLINLLLYRGQLAIDAARMRPLIEDVAHQQHPQHSQRRNRESQPALVLPRDFVRLGGEIDSKTHQKTKAPATPASTDLFTFPAATPAAELETSSSTRTFTNAACKSCGACTPVTSTRSTFTP